MLNFKIEVFYREAIDVFFPRRSRGKKDCVRLRESAVIKIPNMSVAEENKEWI
jgi:hypothetical protein